MNERSYFVLTFIKESKDPISAKRIQALLLEKGMKVDIKTVYETIRRINEFYYPILKTKYILAQRKKGYYISYDYFTDGQMQYMLDATLSNPNLSKEDREDLKYRLLSMSSQNQLDRLFINENIESLDSRLLLNITILTKAISEKKNIAFRYVDYNIKGKQFIEVESKKGNDVEHNNIYIVSPYEITLKGQYYYLIGYFNKRKGSRSTYRIDRMRLLQTHKSEYIDISEQYDMAQDIHKAINMFVSDEQIDLTIRFKKEVTREVVNQFGKNFKVKKDVEGYYKAEIMDVTKSQGLVAWLLMLNKNMEVLAPNSLREEIINTILQLNTLYQLENK
ncbi:helix-turn-helix transcriptional regulator [Tannockella kyphosi]|uniref:helix-turn-helix transcriptional regulator n=1 Tax=Tannockella kyphosi TaxID=2899121 RepID=UPI0020112BB6|nr:WYL domain-containing protein [Tannockella kyphosi]